jgi:DNA polymerase I-like protein with 3'-5' exonuclease and polymerase domains
LVIAPPGYALLQCDWSQQEHAIAGSLSGDRKLIRSYESGDPYLEFAKLGGLVPDGATKMTHPRERDLAKLCVLATQYGQGAEALALRIGCPAPYAEDLLRRHREVYRDFWKWSEQVQDSAVLSGRIRAVHGWEMQVDGSESWRTLANWPMQSTGSEMLRAACVLLHREGVELIAPIHDAVLVQAPSADLEDAAATVRRIMADASEVVLPGMRLRSDLWVVQPGERLLDPEGRELWELSTKILRGLQTEGEAAE